MRQHALRHASTSVKALRSVATVSRDSRVGGGCFLCRICGLASSATNIAASFLGRAEKAGYSALVVTLDTYHLSWRERDLQNAYLPFVRGEGLANYFSDPVFREAVGGDPKWHLVRALEYFGEVFSDPSRRWAVAYARIWAGWVPRRGTAT